MGISLAFRTSRVWSEQPSLILNEEIICRHNDNQSPEAENIANFPNVECIGFTSCTWEMLNIKYSYTEWIIFADLYRVIKMYR
jgi:hypothetical protein